jgi:hypothetical protein
MRRIAVVLLLLGVLSACTPENVGDEATPGTGTSAAPATPTASPLADPYGY